MFRVGKTNEGNPRYAGQIRFNAKVTKDERQLALAMH
jgi:hypothetical protein